MTILLQWVLIELLLCSGSQHSVCVGEVHGPIGSSFREINVELFATFWRNFRTSLLPSDSFITLEQALISPD